ncbi:MAG TPA: M48 family metallopeptidase [Gammaproteobacteria bacterium]|nr:M48 family metallopeptidase [Gammaproteobacteria bacterium]
MSAVTEACNTPGRRPDSVQGCYYDGKRSRRHPARLLVHGGCVRVCNEQGGLLDSMDSVRELRISPRLGNTPRAVYFPGGGHFETPDNDGLDRLMGGGGLVHWLESRYLFVSVSVVLTALLVWWFVVQGVPALARMAAFSLPDTVLQKLGREAHALLDEQWLQPSALSTQEQQRVRHAFAPVLENFRQQGYVLQVHFRGSEDMGANAFALPSGDIVFTDDMVRLAENDDELLAILLHEIGHVTSRHGLRQVIQMSSLMVVITLVTGDVSSLSSMAVSIPIMLMQLGYSRNFEREADALALREMLADNIDPLNFVTIMQRLQQQKACGGKKSATECGRGLPDFLSTHPQTEARLKPFLSAAGN